VYVVQGWSFPFWGRPVLSVWGRPVNIGTMSDRPLAAVVLAAGEGTRMRSTLPKPLHPICGRPMLAHVVAALGQVHVDRLVVVVGFGADEVAKTLTEELADSGLAVDLVTQSVRRGTGDATQMALGALPDDLGEDEAGDFDVLVLPGDTPLVRPETLASLVQAHRSADAAATMLVALPGDPGGYGRVVRGRGGRVLRVVEEADATEEERSIGEVNTSIYCFRRSALAPALRRVGADNAQGEHYLTDVIELLASAGHLVVARETVDPVEVTGVNDRRQLADAEVAMRERINARWMADGVTLVDPATTYVDVGVELAQDVTLLPGCVLQGRTVVGTGATLGPWTRVVDSTVGAGARVEHSTLERTEVGEEAHVGPFVWLEPGTRVAPRARLVPSPGQSGRDG
jgi:bifunctional UDP-N-acetylglucosamine pyrophosphorylase/glucosamine-1-phosphate N-acetyltransferase